jgi:hypothetical protein
VTAPWLSPPSGTPLPQNTSVEIVQASYVTRPTVAETVAVSLVPLAKALAPIAVALAPVALAISPIVVAWGPLGVTAAQPLSADPVEKHCAKAGEADSAVAIPAASTRVRRHPPARALLA